MKKSEAEGVLRPFLVSGPYPGGDWDARCPLHDDKKRSARINFDKNVWVCFAGCGGGKIGELVSRMGHRKEQPVKDDEKISYVNPDDVKLWHRNLMQDPDNQEFLFSRRGLNIACIRRFKLGWDYSSQAYTIPIYRPDGNLYNVRKYRPDSPTDTKIWWAVKTSGELPLYPHDIISKSNWIVICEGEMDALICLQNGVPAVTGLAGAKSWNVRWSEQFSGKYVFVAYDRDETGERSGKMVAEHLEPYAKTIWIATIPIDKKGADVSDFFLLGKTGPEFRQVLKKAKKYEKKATDPSKMTPLEVQVLQSFDSRNIGRAMTMDVHIAGRKNPPFAVPKVVVSTCTQDAGAKCKVCPMMARNGQYTHEVPAWSPAILKMVDSPEGDQHEALRRQIGAVKCDRLVHEVQSYQSVEELFVRPSMDVDSSDFTNRKILGVGKHDTLPSSIVRVLGTSWPEPKTHRNAYLAWSVREVESAIDEFRVTPEVARQLRVFRPRNGETPLQKLQDVAHDLELGVTRIYGRVDLHMAIMLVYHSLISFPFDGHLVQRGWLDALVVGDTRTGKSEAALRIAEHYRAGKMINCEAATFAGIVGGLQQIGAGREWSVTWGMVPMNDRRLVVLDEVSGLTHDQIQQMSDMRSSGKIQLTKIQTEVAWARTRLIWMGNPRDRTMSGYTYGVQAIEPLIGNAEDIARYDFALALTSDDVLPEAIQMSRPRRGIRYDTEDCHELVMWAWSRQPDDVIWASGAEDEVRELSLRIGGHYVETPPLIQAANVRFKIARMAVALAASTFSSDRSGKKLIVKKSHVRGAVQFLHYLYSKEAFGYHQLSLRHREDVRVAVDSYYEAKEYLESKPFLTRFLRQVEGQFRRDMLEQTLNISREEANGTINVLYNWRLVSPDTQAIKVNPVLHELLREIKEG